MKTLTSFFHQALSTWKKRSIAQKATMLYFVVLFVAITVLPLIQVGSLLDETVETFRLRNSPMYKIAGVMFLIIIKLGVWNVRETWRNRIYSIFGFQASIPLINFLGLSMCFLLFLSIVDTVSFAKYHISQHLSMAWGWAVIAVLLLAGMLWQVVIARLQWKQKLKQHDVQSYHQEQHQQQAFYLDKQSEKLL